LQPLSFPGPNLPSSNHFITLADGWQFGGGYAVLLLHGFFIAKETGTYTFQSRSKLDPRLMMRVRLSRGK
jgi:hypothetical protein